MKVEYHDENLYVLADFVKPSMSLELLRFQTIVGEPCLQDKLMFFP
jgi:hypothetical protein